MLKVYFTSVSACFMFDLNVIEVVIVMSNQKLNMVPDEC